MKININETDEIRFSNYYVEIILENDDNLIFALIYTKKNGFCLSFENGLLCDFDCPDDIISGIDENSLIRELTVFEDGIITTNVKGENNHFSFSIKSIDVFESIGSQSSKIRISGNLLKYSKEVADLYGLDSNYAYDRSKAKTKIRTILKQNKIDDLNKFS